MRCKSLLGKKRVRLKLTTSQQKRNPAFRWMHRRGAANMRTVLSDPGSVLKHDAIHSHREGLERRRPRGIRNHDVGWLFSVQGEGLRGARNDWVAGRGLDRFKVQVYGGIFDIEFGKFGPEFEQRRASGAPALPPEWSRALVHHRSRAESDWRPFGKNEVASCSDSLPSRDRTGASGQIHRRTPDDTVR